MLREDRGLSRGLRRGGRRLGRGPGLSGESRRKRKRWRQTPRRGYQDEGEDQYENRAEIETENGARATTRAEVETRVSRRRSRRRARRRRGSRRRSKRGMRQLSPFVFVLGLRVLFSQHLVLVLDPSSCPCPRSQTQSPLSEYLSMLRKPSPSFTYVTRIARLPRTYSPIPRFLVALLSTVSIFPAASPSSMQPCHAPCDSNGVQVTTGRHSAQVLREVAETRRQLPQYSEGVSDILEAIGDTWRQSGVLGGRAAMKNEMKHQAKEQWN